MIKQLYEFTFEDKEHKQEFEQYLAEIDMSNWKRVRKIKKDEVKK